MINLDANLNDQVDGAKVIEVQIGEANRKMMIFSGIAKPDWVINDDDHIYRENVVVNLRRTVLAVEQFTVTVGLASIGNDDTTFLFAADTATVDIDQNSQELLLKVDLASQGERNSIGRFGYQVVTVVTTQTTGISGIIRWSKDLFDPKALSAGQVAQLFRVTANHKERITPPQGFVYDKFTPVAFGVTTGLSAEGNDFIMPYEIPGAPYNQPLVIIVEVGSLFASGGAPFAGQVAGPNPVTLSITTPGITGVDFRVNINILH